MGIQPQRLLIIGDGLGRGALERQDVGEVDAGADVIRLEAQGFLILLDRLGQSVLVHE